jgi:hypothetical protein
MRRSRRVLRALWIASLAGAASSVCAQQACTDEMAWARAGSWGRAGDDLAMADPTFPRAEHAAALRKADQVVALVQQAIPKLDGIEARAYRSIRGPSYTRDGALKYGSDALFRAYYCVPDTPSFPTLRGQVRLGDETGTWLYIRFNDFFWLTNESAMLDKSLRAKGGGALFFFPPSAGEWKGLPLLLPAIHTGQKTEAVIIAPPGRAPHRFITREEFLEARVRQLQERIDKLPPSPTRPKVQAGIEADLHQIRAALAALSPEERKREAIVRNPLVVPGGRDKVFVTEADGGRRIFVIRASFFDPSLPRTAVQFITVYWRWDAGPKDPAKVAVARQFKENFDLDALRAMLGR